MLIGIDASRAFRKNRTGIEEYSYQVIKHLVDKLEGHQVVLYVRTTNYELHTNIQSTNQLNNQFALPNNWKIKTIKFPYLWTQVGLSLELLFHPVDILFVPGHIVPIIHPTSTIATVHGLEYEFCPKAYSIWERLYMRWSIKKSCQWAKKIIAVSENTKKDLINLYKVPAEKIEVVYEGVADNFKFSILNFQSIFNDKILKPYLLFIGRLEERKNICGIIEAYKILKEKYNIPHSLVLTGSPGYNYKNIKSTVNGSQFVNEIIETGFVSDEEKWELLKNADVFLFPTFYEGFGLPVLEAQSVGTPVAASNNSSIPEVAGSKTEFSEFLKLGFRKDDAGSVLLANPHSPEDIAEATYELISDKVLRDDIIKKGSENVKRFSWEECSLKIANCLTTVNNKVS
jgi:glycosyltransferase involved in cell wall biosynthesis